METRLGTCSRASVGVCAEKLQSEATLKLLHDLHCEFHPFVEEVYVGHNVRSFSPPSFPPPPSPSLTSPPSSPPPAPASPAPLQQLTS